MSTMAIICPGAAQNTKPAEILTKPAEIHITAATQRAIAAYLSIPAKERPAINALFIARGALSDTKAFVKNSTTMSAQTCYRRVQTARDAYDNARRNALSICPERVHALGL